MRLNIFKQKAKKIESESTKTDTFCMMPWVHFHVAQNGNVIPCCQAPPHKVHRFGNINEQSISEIWKGEAIQTFRKKMLEGEKDVRCKQCYIKEEQGWKSLRQITNHKFKEERKAAEELGVNANEPVYFDLRFSNACNLKCRICGPWASSQWFKDAVALGMRQKGEKAITLAIKNEADFFKELSPLLSTAKEFYFAGGEPLMMEQHYQLLDALIACGNTDVQLTYNTNFSNFTFKNYNVLDYWKKFPNISIAASLDAEGKRGEFLRKNINWDKVLQNRRTIMAELGHIVFQISPTVCIFNVAHLPNFHKNWVEQGLIHVEDFIPNVLINPKEYHISALPLEEQVKLKAIYQTHIDWMKSQQYSHQEKYEYTLGQFESIFQQLGTHFNPKLITELTLKTQQLDVLRKEDTAEVFPELNSIWEASNSPK
ncbi:MAG: twitch domain-containing radical SAM protein [Flavobacteriales bacterium]|nr:twitch domain-containing radical SAM protein [Flavobacteriales bacterium]